MPDTVAPPSLPAPGELRACMSRFATGVAVVTYATADGPRGVTINSFTSVSADPPLVLVSVARKARCHDELSGRPFCVNILGAEQEPLAKLFAGMPVPAGAAGAAGPAGPVPRWVPGARIPRLVSPLAWIECEPWRRYDGGDHTLVLGQVTELDHRDGDALTYAWSRFDQISQGVQGVEYLF